MVRKAYIVFCIKLIHLEILFGKMRKLDSKSYAYIAI
jgi:hypothetical protein